MSGLTKADLQAQIERLEQENVKALTYEGLASLIVQQGLNDKEWRDDFKSQFSDYRKENKAEHQELKNYNIKQNGRQVDMMEEVVELKRESNERKLTCGAAVAVLTKAKETAEKEAKISVSDKKKITRLNIQWGIMSLIALGSLIAYLLK